MDLLFLLLLLQIKHWYADFVIQTYMQTVKKGVWLNPIGVSHSVDHVWGTMIVLLIFNLIVPISALVILAVSLIEGVIHYCIDFVKVKYGCKDNTKPLFWNQFGMDQLAHQICYLTIVTVLLV
jgi:hypothetical protein